MPIGPDICLIAMTPLLFAAGNNFSADDEVYRSSLNTSSNQLPYIGKSCLEIQGWKT